jgi:cytochrome c-type biogenesis protein CcmH/NrfG
MAEWKPRVRKLAGGEREEMQFINSLVKEQRYDEAQEQLEAFLEKNKTSFAATVAMGRLFQKKKQFKDAVIWYERAAKLDPMQAQAPMRAGLSYLRLEDLDKAEAAFQRALDLDGKNARARVGLAQVYFMREDLNRSVAEVREALRYDPQLVQARMLLARIQNKAGSTDEAISEMRNVATLRPERRRVATQMARLYLKKDEPDKAEEVLLEAVEQEPNDAVAWDLLGRIRLRQEDYESASDAFREAVRLKPKQVSTHLRLVEALIGEGKAMEARKVLDDLPRKRHMSNVVHKFTGDIYRSEKKYKEAVEFYRAALLKTPGGDAVVADIEEGTSPVGEVDWEALADAYEPAMTKLMNEVRSERRSAKESTSPRRPKEAAPGRGV